MNVNEASRAQLLRVPGVGPTSAERIMRNRGRHAIDNWRDLQAMGVVRKWAWPFLVFPGHRPPRAKQLRLDLFGEHAKEKRKENMTAWTPNGASQAQHDGSRPVRHGLVMHRLPTLRRPRPPGVVRDCEGRTLRRCRKPAAE